MIQDKRIANKEKILEYLSRMPFYKWAAKFAMIDEDTLKHWRDEDPDFAGRCESSRSEAIQRLGGRATPDFLLKNADPATFKDKSNLDVTSGGKKIETNTIVLTNFKDETKSK